MALCNFQCDHQHLPLSTERDKPLIIAIIRRECFARTQGGYWCLCVRVFSGCICVEKCLGKCENVEVCRAAEITGDGDGNDKVGPVTGKFGTRLIGKRKVDANIGRRMERMFFQRESWSFGKLRKSELNWKRDTIFALDSRLLSHVYTQLFRADKQ